MWRKRRNLERLFDELTAITLRGSPRVGLTVSTLRGSNLVDSLNTANNVGRNTRSTIA